MIEHSCESLLADTASGGSAGQGGALSISVGYAAYPLLWPAVEHPTSAALIGVESIDPDGNEGEYDLRVLDLDQEADLRARAGETCERGK